MLFHINSAAYTYKGSFAHYATPHKGREGHLDFRCSYCETHMEGTPAEKKNVKEKKWSEVIKKLAST